MRRGRHVCLFVWKKYKIVITEAKTWLKFHGDAFLYLRQCQEKPKNNTEALQTVSECGNVGKTFQNATTGEDNWGACGAKSCWNFIELSHPEGKSRKVMRKVGGACSRRKGKGNCNSFATIRKNHFPPEVPPQSSFLCCWLKVKMVMASKGSSLCVKIYQGCINSALHSI